MLEKYRFYFNTIIYYLHVFVKKKTSIIFFITLFLYYKKQKQIFIKCSIIKKIPIETATFVISKQLKVNKAKASMVLTKPEKKQFFI